MTYTCKKEMASTYCLTGAINATDSLSRWWANITIREWPQGGSIDIQSDFGNYAYSWRSIGDKCLREFLCRLRFDYFMEKMRGRSYLELDTEATRLNMLKDVLRGRREGRIDKEQAQLFWDDIKGLEGSMQEMCFVDCLVYEEEIVKHLYDSLHADIPWTYAPSMKTCNFWKYVWPSICEVWQQELAVAA